MLPASLSELALCFLEQIQYPRPIEIYTISSSNYNDESASVTIDFVCFLV